MQICIAFCFVEFAVRQCEKSEKIRRANRRRKECESSVKAKGVPKRGTSETTGNNGLKNVGRNLFSVRVE